MNIKKTSNDPLSSLFDFFIGGREAGISLSLCQLSPYISIIRLISLKSYSILNILKGTLTVALTKINMRINFCFKFKELNHSSTTMIVFGSLQNFTSF